MHSLNVDPTVNPVKGKSYVNPENDKFMQDVVRKLLEASHIKEIQFSEWLSNVVMVDKGNTET